MNQKLLDIFRSAVAAVNPNTLLRSGVQVDTLTNSVKIFGSSYHLEKRFHVIGFGKAVMGMASAMQQILRGRLKSGILSVPEGTKITVEHPLEVYKSGKNNIPDLASVEATEKIIQMMQTVPKDDVLIVLISGGGSTLLCKPIPEITLEDKLLTIKMLTTCGADIQELNTVRKRLSLVKGGGLLNYFKGIDSICLVLSDVIGNPLTSIASGPTVPNSDEPNAALDVIRKYRLELKLPRHVLQSIQKKSFDKVDSEKVKNIIIGSNEIALNHAKKTEETPDFKIICVSSEIHGSVFDVASFYWTISKSILQFLNSGDASKLHSDLRLILRGSGFNFLSKNLAGDIVESTQNASRICLLFGGETTVRVNGKGKGGRNQELAVIFSQMLYDAKKETPGLFAGWDISFLSAGTDGIDGPTDAAGAIGSAEFAERALSLGLNIDAYLANNDSNTLLSKVDGGKYLIKTGHTGTNVMDVHALVVFKDVNAIKSSL